MRRVFNIAVLMLLAYLTAGREETGSQAGEEDAISCAKGARLVRLGAIDKGFSDAASSGPGQNFLSSCLETCEGRVNHVVARD